VVLRVGRWRLLSSGAGGSSASGAGGSPRQALAGAGAAAPRVDWRLISPALAAGSRTLARGNTQGWDCFSGNFVGTEWLFIFIGQG
jgi:hypothetical protein